MFETKRLRLRAFVPADSPTFWTWWNDPALMRLQSEHAIVPKGPSQVIDIMQNWSATALLFLCAEELNGRDLVGMVHIWGGEAKNRDYRLATVLAPKVWGQGYGRELLRFALKHAFDELGVHRVTLNVLAYNERAVRCYRSVGFQLEGTLRRAVFRDGGWHDFLVMGILREDLVLS